ncbi:MAG: CrcB family protein [Corynebacterium sp.]|nr:CrcB family protein [Corynebacterium sp.]
MSILLVFLGGVLGGMGRFLLTKVLPPYFCTFIANMCACLILGITARLFAPHSLTYAAAGIGCAGALSTWSTLAAELGSLLQSQKYALFGAYLSTTLVGGLAAVSLGMLV